jgi:hypothetical protein
VRERLQARRGSGIKWVPGYGYVTPASNNPTVGTEETVVPYLMNADQMGDGEGGAKERAHEC